MKCLVALPAQKWSETIDLEPWLFAFRNQTLTRIAYLGDAADPVLVTQKGRKQDLGPI